MKRIFAGAVICLFIGCATTKQVVYDFPEAMLPEVKTAYSERCDKGQQLYNAVCSGCHNTGSKRKPVIPDFTPEQLKGYALRVSNRQHETNMPDSLVTEEELGIIMTFLTYKKKNNAPSR